MPKADNYAGNILRLTPRETEVLKWTACGKTNPEISGVLGISEETVRSHIRNVCTKLDAVNKTHAAVIAIIHGVIGLGPSPERVIPLPTLFGLSRYQAMDTKKKINKPERHAR